MNKQEIDSKDVVRSIIIGFIAYGIITTFLCLFILAITTFYMSELGISNIRGLYITLPLIAVILLYFVIHSICKLSTYDVFKKSKTSPDNYKEIVKYLNIFFIICIIISIISFLSLLYFHLRSQVLSIEFATIKYKEVFSDEHIEMLHSKMENSYNESKTNLTIATNILEIGIAISFLSLIPYQRKMIVKYNES